MANDFDVGPIVPDSQQPSTPTAQPPADPTGEAASGTMAGEGPGTQGNKDTSGNQQTDWHSIMVEEIQKVERREQEYEAKAAPMYERLQQSIQDYQKTLQQQPPQAPQLQSQAAWTAQQNQLNQDANKARFTYLAVALPLAIILGARGRGASWAAMGAFGQGLTALQQGLTDKANQRYKDWQEANKELIDNYDLKMQQYKAVLENRKLSIEAQTTMINAIAAANNDSSLNRLKTISEIQKNLEGKEAAGEKAKQEFERLRQQYLYHMGETAEGQAYRAKVQRDFGYDPYESEEARKQADKDEPFDKFDAQWQADHAKERQGENPESDPLGIKGGTPDEEKTKSILSNIGIQ